MEQSPEVVEDRWRRFGHDRVYIRSADGTSYGFIDLKAGTAHPEAEQASQLLNERLQHWLHPDQASPPVTPKSTPPATATSTAKSSGDHSGLPKLIVAKRDSVCTCCGTTVAKGQDLFWIPGTKVAVCPPCTAAEAQLGFEQCGAGTAAGRIADAASRKHAERLLSAYPMLGEHLVKNARPTNNMNAWIRGADGERVVGRRLDKLASEDKILVLHDRRTPGGGNIDHLVIGRRRVSVVDAKNYRDASVSVGKSGLVVGDRDAEHLIDGVRRQVDYVRDALADLDLSDAACGVLAFVGAKFGWLGSLTHRGVWCSDPKEAASFVAFRHAIGFNRVKLEAEQRAEIASALSAAFPPA